MKRALPPSAIVARLDDIFNVVGQLTEEVMPCEPLYVVNGGTIIMKTP